jgi:GNAT superfamily N-acetyltransferase
MCLVRARAGDRIPPTPRELADGLRREGRTAAWVAGPAGAPAGVASLERIESYDEPGGMWMEVWVVPHLRGTGAGRALWTALVAGARERGVGRLRTAIDGDDAPTARFLVRRGFAEVHRDQRVRLVLTSPPPAPYPPAGIRLAGLDREPGLVTAIPLIEADTLGDVPGDAPLTVAGVDEWREALAGPRYAPALTVVALDGSAPAGYASLRLVPARPSFACHEYTAVRPPWRGRGLATALKRELLRRAWWAGIRELEAQNALGNAPMRAVNARLGYTRLADRVGMVRDRPGASGPDGAGDADHQPVARPGDAAAQP